MLQPLWKNSLPVSYNVIDKLTVQPSNSISKYLPKRIKTYVYTKIYTQIFILALFVIAQNWKQPKHLSTCQWENCDIYI